MKENLGFFKFFTEKRQFKTEKSFARKYYSNSDMNVTSNTTTGYFRWAPPPRNDRVESSLTYLALVVVTVLIFSILMVTRQRQLRKHLQLAMNAFNSTLHGERITTDLNVFNKESNEK